VPSAPCRGLSSLHGIGPDTIAETLAITAGGRSSGLLHVPHEQEDVEILLDVVDRVRCSEPAPSCPDGQAAAVAAGCWGPCVPIAMCRCDQNWQCPTGTRCALYPTFRCGPPVDAGAGSDGG